MVDGTVARVRERSGMLLATIGGPAVPVLQITAYYIAVPVACNQGAIAWPLHLISVIALAGVAGAGTIAWRGLRDAREQNGDRTPAGNGDLGFVYAIGAIGTALGAVAVVLMGLAALYFDPCAGDHEFRLPGL